MEAVFSSILSPILVTGATGMIGSSLVYRLLQLEKEVHVFVLPTDQIPLAWEGRVHIHWGDIAQKHYVERAMEDCQIVFHLAAVVSDWGLRSLFQQVNVDGTSHVLETAASRNIRVILTTGSAVYGRDLAFFECHEDRPHGQALSFYGMSLQAQERIALQLMATYRLACTIVRPANVYGPGSRNWVYDLIEAIKRGPTLLGDGKQNAGLVHVDNVAEILLLAAAKKRAIGEIYNAAEENKVDWMTYQKDLAKAAGTPSPRYFPKSLAWGIAKIQEWVWKRLSIGSRPHFTLEAINRIGSNHRIPINKAKQELGYQPKKSYQEGMKELKDFLQKQYLTYIDRRKM